MVQFFRSGQHDDRRRRVLTEEVTASAVATPAKSAARGAARRYAVEALRDHQPRLIDFIPQRLTTLCLLFALGLAVIGGLEAIYATRVLDLKETRLPSFDLMAEGSLNNWFSSVALDLAGVVALVIFSLRRHRMDDHHGRYRIWILAAVCWLWLSVDEAASLHESLQAALTELAGQSAKETEMLWIGTYALLIGGVSLRLIFEMRPCRSSITAFVFSGATFAASIVAHMGWLPPAALEYQVLIEEGCEMGGSLLLLLAMCLHARYIILDTQGLIAARPQKEQDAKETSRRGLFGGKKTKIDAAHATVKPSSKRSDLESVTAKKVADDDEDEDDSDTDGDEDDDESSRAHDVNKLSKAERKAMRRQQERQRKNRLG